MLLRFLLGAGLAAVVGGAAARAGLLSASGVVAATVVGAAAVTASWSWAVLLVVFFATTSALSAYGADQKRESVDAVLAKGVRRDAMQVLANGGVFAVAGAAWLATGSAAWLAAGAGAIATSAADSWATEIGMARGGVPRAITSGKRLPRGISGGVTPAGSFGGMLGATVIAGTMLIIGWPLPVAITAVFAGVLGMIVDSVLGATLQARRLCPSCGTETEQTVHKCGRNTQIVHGIRWMDNDVINILATVSGAAIAWIIFFAFFVSA